MLASIAIDFLDIMDGENTVIDDNIGDYSTTQLFFRLSISYAESSHKLFASMLNNELPKSFAHAQASHFLLDHSLELFFKGAILKKGENAGNKHHLENLYNKYRKLYPKDEFNFTGRILETVTHDPNAPNSEFPRYPINTKGEIWAGYNAYTLDKWFDVVESVRDDLQRLISKIEPLPTPAF